MAYVRTPGGGSSAPSGGNAPAPTGSAATDTATVQAAILSGDRLRPGTYVVTKLTVPTFGRLLGSGVGQTIIKLADGSNSHIIETTNFGTLTGTDNSTTPYNFVISDLTLDGNKANQTAGNWHGIAIYAYGYTVTDVTVRNCRGIGFWTEWASASPFLDPDGMEAFITNYKIHDCDGGGIYHAGPHDAIFSNGFVVQRSGTATGKAAVRIPIDGRANGSVFQMLHVYGGLYEWGLVVNSSGCEFIGCQFEGAQTAQVVVQASMNKFSECKFFPGGVAASTVRGIVFGDASHTNINNVRVTGKVEDCGGGVLDLTYSGGDHTIDLHAQYISMQVPASPIVGTFDQNSRVLLTVIAPSGTASEFTRSQFPGRLRFSGGALPAGGFNGVGTGGGLSVASWSTDTRGQLTLTGPTGGAAGDQCYVTWSGSNRTGNVKVLLQAENAAAAGIGLYVVPANWGFTVRTTGVPAAGVTYVIDWFSFD